MSNEVLLHKVKDILGEYVQKEFKDRNGLDYFGWFELNWIKVNSDSVTLQFIMSKRMSNYIHTINILNELFLKLFHRKWSNASKTPVDNFDNYVHRLTISYEDLAYVYTYLSLKLR